MSIIQSIKGKDQLILDGFRYRRDRLVWRCVKINCKGRARYDGVIYEMYQDHICQAPDPDEIEKAVFNHEIRSKAEQSHDQPRLIIQEARLKLSLDAAAIIPQYTASQRTIQRVRTDKDIPTEPKTFVDIVIPPKFQLTASTEQFLLYDNNDNDNNDNDNRILIFSSKQHLDLLNRCESWHCDGTFKVAPKLFEQMYSIHGLIRGKTLPLLYALLPNKNQQTYETVFRTVGQHIQNKPTFITIDFEKVAENAFATLFSPCEILGCFFHYKQSIWRNICELGLKKEFLGNEVSRRTMKNLAALAFVPEQNVIQEFTQIKENAPEVLDELLMYFEDNFIGRKMSRNRRSNPRFSISMWNCFSRVDLDLPRTNNAVEGWHNAFHNVAGDHPSFFKFMKDIIREEKNTTVVSIQMLVRTATHNKRKKYRKTDDRIRQMVKDFNVVSREDYFKIARSVFNF